MDKRNFYDYGFQVRKLSKEDGGGYIATINEFDGVMAAGDTVDEALDLLSEVIHDVVITAKEIGRKLPKPRIYEEVDYSGKFLLRIPKSLHKRLSNKAAEEGISLNQYVTSLISYNFGFEESKRHEIVIYDNRKTDIKHKRYYNTQYGSLNTSKKKNILSWFRRKNNE